MFTMEIPTWLSAMAVALGIAAILGGVVATFRASYSKARIEALREDNDDLRDRVGDLEKKEERLADREAELQKEIAHIRSENELLKELVLQRVEITGLGDLMTMHHKQAMDHWDRLTKTLEKALDKNG